MESQSLSVKRAQVEFHNFASMGEPERALRVYGEENQRRGAIIDDHLDYIGPMTPFLEIGANAGHATSGAGLIGPVRLVSKNRVVSSVPASEFGEFQMEFEVRSGLRLVIPCAGRRAEIEVPLDVLFQRKNGSAKPDSK